MKKYNITVNEIMKSDCAQNIIEPVWFSVNIYDSIEQYNKDLAAFSLPQRYVFAIQWYSAEVCNGGHDQFFFNSTGIVWKDALMGLKEIGAQKNAEILESAVERMGGTPAFDREERWNQMDELEPDFDDLDDDFYEGDNLEEIVMKYIKEHAQDFVFCGEVDIDL